MCVVLLMCGLGKKCNRGFNWGFSGDPYRSPVQGCVMFPLLLY